MSTATRRVAKTKRGKRVLHSREPKQVEGPKRLLVLKGHATSQLVGDVLGDLASMVRPLSHRLSRKNPEIMPFEAGKEAGLERLASKFECSLFALGNHTKKRPHNLVLGRLFDGHLLDAVELGVSDFQPMKSFKGAKCAVDSKPCIIFVGEVFENDDTYRRIKNIFIDLLKGEQVDDVNLAMVDHVYVLSAEEGSAQIRFRHYTIVLKKADPKTSDGRLPRIELEESGPAMDLTPRRTHFASEDLWKAATRKPKRAGTPTDGGVVAKKQKNVSWDAGLGDTVGQVHVGRQDLSMLALRKTKALGKGKGAAHGDDSSEDSHLESI